MSRSERNTQLSMNQYPRYAQCNVQRRTFNIQPSTAAAVERWTLNVWPKVITPRRRSHRAASVHGPQLTSGFWRCSLPMNLPHRSPPVSVFSGVGTRSTRVPDLAHQRAWAGSCSPRTRSSPARSSDRTSTHSVQALVRLRGGPEDRARPLHAGGPSPSRLRPRRVWKPSLPR